MNENIKDSLYNSSLKNIDNNLNNFIKRTKENSIKRKESMQRTQNQDKK